VTEVPIAGKPNWLLRGLLAVSIGFHALALGVIAGKWPDTAPLRFKIDLTASPPTPQPASCSPVVPPARQRPLQGTPNGIPSPPLPRPMTAFEPTPLSPVEPIRVPENQLSAIPDPMETPPPSPAGENDRTAPAVASSRTFAADGVESPESPASSAPTPADPAAAGAYYGMVREWIGRHQIYPDAARRRGLEGRVRLRFLIGKDGAVRGIQVLDESDHAVLNRAALEAVKASSPFPEPPSGLFPGPVPIEISILYRLT